VNQKNGPVGVLVGQLVQEEAHDLGRGGQEDVGHEVQIDQELPEDEKARDAEIRKKFQDPGIFPDCGSVQTASPNQSIRDAGGGAFTISSPPGLLSSGLTK
jgi:hypothetical protein